MYSDDSITTTMPCRHVANSAGDCNHLYERIRRKRFSRTGSSFKQNESCANFYVRCISNAQPSVIAYQCDFVVCPGQ